jgi:ornithine cyclodeaminase/alanine dehydrogenase-like protein (mu-crystallin family)
MNSTPRTTTTGRAAGDRSQRHDLILLSAEDIRAALPMPQAIEAAKAAYASVATGAAVAPPRMVVTSPAGCTLLMGAQVPGEGLAGKIVSIFPPNRDRGLPVVAGIVVLLDPETGLPRALMDGTALTAWRTGAAGGAATDLLARPEASVAAVFGCGAQARTQVLGIDAVRNLEVIRVFSRTPRRTEEFVAEMQPALRGRLEISRTPREAVRDADVICTATTSTTPVFDGRDLAPGAHVNAMGSFKPDMQEVDVVTIAAARVFVDSREAALEEAGDLLKAAAQGWTRYDEWTQIGDVVAGIKAGRHSSDEITYFKSVGLAVQDVTAGARALMQAQRLGLGGRIQL